jgi:hypothetical protein
MNNILALNPLTQFARQEDRLFLNSKCLQAQLRQCSKLSRKMAVCILNSETKMGSPCQKLQL